MNSHDQFALLLNGLSAHEAGGNTSFLNQHTQTTPHSTSSANSAISTLSQSLSSNVTTLELHPNVILGIPDDEDNSNGGERPHLCTVCHASYKTRTHLRRHMFIHMSARPFPCPECGKGFNRKEHLNKHLEAVHSGTKHHCPYCDKEISRLDHLKRHIKNMHANMTKAGRADKQAVLKVQLPCGQRHKAQLSFLTPSFPPGTIGQTIITPIPLSATCDLDVKVKTEPSECPERNNFGREACDSAPSMTIIPSNVLGPGQGVATLAIQSTPTQKVLVHQRLPSGSNVSFPSTTNGLAGLANLSLSLGGHPPLNNATEGGDKKMLLQLQIFNCGECTATFTTEKDLTAHARTHKPQPFRCPDCTRAYTRREKLTEHIRCVHQGQKFSCDYCGKELSRKDHVLRHIRSVHPEVYAGSFVEMGDSEIRIDDQGRLVSTSTSSPNNSQLRKRKSPQSATLNIPSIGDVGVLLRSVCHVCLKVFGTAYHLTRHIESCHNGDVRPFSCLACNKMFKRKDHLTKHMKSHCPSLKEGALPNQLTIHSNTISSNRSPTCPSHNGSKGVVPKEEAEGLLSDTSTSSDCHHTILQNLQVNLGSSQPSVGASAPHTIPGVDSHHHTSANVMMGGDPQKHSSDQNGFSLAVIDSFMQGNVNVVVVDEEISNFLQQSSTSHLTTTFPCGQCQKEFPARDQLIAHLQEHANDSVLQNDQHISGISFSDF